MVESTANGAGDAEPQLSAAEQQQLAPTFDDLIKESEVITFANYIL